MRNSDTSTVERRLRRLELTNRVLVAALLAVAVVPLLGARLQATDEIEARRIRLVDDEGRVRIELRHDDSETGVFIMDGVGDTRLGAAHFEHGGTGYALHGPGGRGAAVLYLKGDGSLTFYDADGGVTGRVPGQQP